MISTYKFPVVLKTAHMKMVFFLINCPQYLYFIWDIKSSLEKKKIPVSWWKAIPENIKAKKRSACCVAFFSLLFYLIIFHNLA